MTAMFITYTFLEESDYMPFGTRFTDSFYAPTDTTNRHRFAGKEEQAFASLPYIDFGARLYDPVTARWLRTDIFSASTSDISPYSFCAGDPVNLIDPWGLSSYLVNGEAFGIDDGDDSFSMAVTERQYERLVRKFNNNMLSYARYRNRLSKQNGYNTLATTSENATGNGEIAGSVITAHSPGSSYLDYQASGAWMNDIASAYSSIASLASNKQTLDRIRVGNNDTWYYRQPSGKIFNGNQYVAVSPFMEKYAAELKMLKGAGTILNGVSCLLQYSNVIGYEGKNGVNTTLFVASKISGYIGGNVTGKAFSFAGATLGSAASPAGAIIAGAAAGVIGNYCGSIFFERLASGSL